MSTTQATTIDTETIKDAERRIPPWGGFSTTILGLELRRLMRNRRSMIFTLIMPPVFFLLFGSDASYRSESAGSGNVTAYIMVSMAVYGAMIASTSGGAMVSIERAAGWSRQLRLTPLRPLAYISTKVLVAMTMGLAAICMVCAVGLFRGAEIPVGDLILCAALAWVGATVFAAFGLFMGYLLPADNVMQVLGPLLAFMSFAGGLFVPLDQMGDVFSSIAQFTPVYGVGVIARYPLDGTGDFGIALLNVLVWAGIFIAGAGWRFSRDTARV